MDGGKESLLFGMSWFITWDMVIKFLPEESKIMGKNSETCITFWVRVFDVGVEFLKVM